MEVETLQVNLAEQIESIMDESTEDVFRAEPCKNGPRHNCELNINA